jgi:hypothetical protein
MSPQEPLLLVIAGSAIFTVGLLTLCAHFASALSREQIRCGSVSSQRRMASLDIAKHPAS